MMSNGFNLTFLLTGLFAFLSCSSLELIAGFVSRLQLFDQFKDRCCPHRLLDRTVAISFAD